MTSWTTAAGGKEEEGKCGTDPLFRRKIMHQARTPQVKLRSLQVSLALDVLVWVSGLPRGSVYTRALAPKTTGIRDPSSGVTENGPRFMQSEAQPGLLGLSASAKVVPPEIQEGWSPPSQSY